MSKPSLYSSALACVVALVLFYAGAGWWALLVYVVDIYSYGCGIAKGCSK